MLESNFWKSIRDGLRKASNNEIFLQRHEDKISLGIPDVSYSYKGLSGWIELKYIPTIPIKQSTALKIKLSEHQKLWIREYTKKEGRAWVLLRIDCAVFLVKGVYASALTKISLDQLKEICSGWWIAKHMNYDQLLEKLTCDDVNKTKETKLSYKNN